MATMVLAPELERSRPVGDYIEELVTAAVPPIQIATGNEWIDAVRTVGLKFSITYDAYSGTPTSFSVEPASNDFDAAGWRRLADRLDGIGKDKVLAALHARKVADPLLDLIQRTRAYEAHPIGFYDGQEGWHGFPLLHGEQLKAPAATTMAGVWAGLNYAFQEAEGFDYCADGVFRGAFAGLANIFAGPPHETIAAVLADRTEPSGDLLPLIDADRDAVVAFNAHDLWEGGDHDRLEAEMHAADAALREAFVKRGADCKTFAEAKAATQRATYYYQNDDELSAALALSALAYFLGEEAVS